MNDLVRTIDGVEAPARFTVEEFQRLCEVGVFEGSKVELVEGVIVRMSPSQMQHAYYRRVLTRELEAVYDRLGNSWVVYPELSLQLGPATVRDADVAVIAPFRPQRGFASPENVLLAVEVSVTTLGYDLDEKARDYARAGIRHYWVVDPAKRRIHMMTAPLDGGYAE
jgi:Uma2 family endonuclease